MLIACGINYKTTPIELREQWRFEHQTVHSTLAALRQQQLTEEAVILSTCNRSEIYCQTTQPINILDWFATRCGKQLNPDQHLYWHQDQSALQHMVRVACGLDSMVLGEPQILGQMKEAYLLAQNAGTVGQQFKRLFPYIFNTAKHIRTHTEVGQHSLSLAKIISEWLAHFFSDMQQSSVLLIGAGEIIESVAEQFHSDQLKTIYIANRHRENAEPIARRYSATVCELANIETILTEVDVVVSATASPLPIIGKGLIERVLKQRKSMRPLVLFDLALPRDIEPECSQLAEIYLYNLDDLKTIMAQSLAKRQLAAQDAEQYIEHAIQHYMKLVNVHDACRSVQIYRERAYDLSQQLLAEAKRALANGQCSELVLEKLTNRLVNKLLHPSTIKLRELAYQGQTEQFKNLCELLDIESTL